MTREEAIMELKQFSGTTQLKLSANFWGALNRAIKALEQEPCDDWYDISSNEMTLEQARQAVRDLRKFVMNNHILPKLQSSDDCVSRRAVLNLIEHYNSDGLGSVFYGYQEGIKFADKVKKLPPVTPTRKKGYWIDSEILGEFKCSCCGNYWQDAEENEYEDWVNIAKFCPVCGAEMESEE